MASIKVLAGDFSKLAPSAYHFGSLSLTPSDSKWGSPKNYTVKGGIAEMMLADERSSVKTFGAAAWGSLGALMAGPAGLIAGAILGGRGQRVVFVATFHDGKRLMAECDKSTWIKMLAQRL
jgi:hypothetical protein